MRFKDRTEAGKKLAQALEKYRDQPAVVYALPRGGVVLAVEIAQALRLPLDLIIPRKIGHPYNAEYAIGAVTEEGEPVYNEGEITRLDSHWLKQQLASERQEARRRREQYLQGREPLPVAGKTAILVDDGIATGLTMLAAVGDVKKRQPVRLVVAIPVAPQDTAERLLQEADEVVGLEITRHYRGAVGAYYDYFPQVSDAEVIRLMQQFTAA
jgi:putative phosphoribosyl transferase